jgi:beta-phosphoglucomutase-like phosphatase (HAD superfamily)
MTFRGAIFDVDGVLVDSPHERAWRDTLDELMQGPWSEVRDDTTWTPGGLTPLVYERVVSGRPRQDGALAALEHFGVPEAAARAAEYAEVKQLRVSELIARGEFTAFADALRFVVAVRAAGLRLAAASSSKNAAAMLRRIRTEAGGSLLDLFDADTSGRDVPHGKPAPDIFLAAAAALGLPPAGCFVVEDAIAGIQAAKAGAMSALGVARENDAALLAGAGADLVVATLDDVDVSGLRAGRLERRQACVGDA